MDLGAFHAVFALHVSVISERRASWILVREWKMAG